VQAADNRSSNTSRQRGSIPRCRAGKDEEAGGGPSRPKQRHQQSHTQSPELGFRSRQHTQCQHPMTGHTTSDALLQLPECAGTFLARQGQHQTDGHTHLSVFPDSCMGGGASRPTEPQRNGVGEGSQQLYATNTARSPRPPTPDQQRAWIQHCIREREPIHTAFTDVRSPARPKKGRMLHPPSVV
jgi:hypothetical protein